MVGIVTLEASELSALRLPRPQQAGRSERALIRGAQAGSKADLEELFRRHWPPAYRAAYYVVYDRAAAEDIAQEAWLSAIRALDRFDRRRPFGPWLHRIVVNRAIDWARARALRREIEASAEGPVADGVEHELGARDELDAALATLSPERRAVVVLRYLLDYMPARSPSCSSCRAAP